MPPFLKSARSPAQLRKEISINPPTSAPLSSIAPGPDNLPKLTLVAADGARADFYLHGAHVTSWLPAGGAERLFLSRTSAFRSGAPIRGGIPVVFPQFGMMGPLPLHGLVRLMEWEFAGSKAEGNRAAATFRLCDTEGSRCEWPNAFLAELTVTIGGSQLAVTLAVTNAGTAPVSFTTAFHTYLSVADIAATSVEGLESVQYRDVAADGIEAQQVAPQVDFPGEANRIYFDAPAEARLIERGRTTVVRKAGFSDVVVWNPAAEKCAALSDLEPNDYQRFVCVEAAIVGTPVRLAPSERWEGTQALAA